MISITQLFELDLPQKLRMPIRWKGKKYWIDRSKVFDAVKNENSIKLPLTLDKLDITEDWNNLKLDRVKRANLKYPIIIDPNYEVLDGLHRIKKANLLKKKFINCKVFNPDNHISSLTQVDRYNFD
jgi:hypothetical protein